jgi:formamidopyrimidine-DNA glycosylase
MPELPEVEALKNFLTEHLVGHEITRVLPVAISVLKTYDPPLTALEGREVTAVHRHGKFLDLRTAGGPHFVTHLARAGRLKAEKKSGLRVHGRTGEPCPVCGDTVRK